MHLLLSFQAKIDLIHDWGGLEEGLSKLTARFCLNWWDLVHQCSVQINRSCLPLLNWTDLTLTMKELSCRNTILWDVAPKLLSSRLKDLNLLTHLLALVLSAPLTIKTMVTKIERAVSNNNSSRDLKRARSSKLSKLLNLLIINRHLRVIIVLSIKEAPMLTRAWLLSRLQL